MTKKTSQNKAWFVDDYGKEYHLRDDVEFPVIIGRMASQKPGNERFVGIQQNEFTLTVSRKHALLWWSEEKGWEIGDAGSRLGLLVNGKKIKGNARRPLKHDDEITLGKFRLVFKTQKSNRKSFDFPAQPKKEMKNFDLTQPIPDLKPSAPPDFSQFEQEKYFLVAVIGDQVTEIEIPQAPMRNKWSVGRYKYNADKRSGDATRYHVHVPNIPEHQTISRKHILLIKENDSWKVQHISRTQRTWVNQRELKHQETVPLESGDQLILGQVLFYFKKGTGSKKYTSKDFQQSQPKSGKAASRTVDPEKTFRDDTQELSQPLLSFQEDGQSDEWGYLIENKLDSPERLKLNKRIIKIGSHPLNCDIQMDDPGISDVYAVIKWKGKSVFISSKNKETPVRVNNRAYRNSPPLNTNDTITLGTREFTLFIRNPPQDLIPEQAKKRLRRSLIFFVAVLNLLFFGLLFGIKSIKPEPEKNSFSPPPSWEKAKERVLLHSGLKGIGALKDIIQAENYEEDTVIRRAKSTIEPLQKMEYAYQSIEYCTEQEFREKLGDIEDIIQELKLYLSEEYPQKNRENIQWLTSIENSYQARKDGLFSEDWKQILAALKKSRFEKIRELCATLNKHNVKTEKTAEVLSLINTWEQKRRKLGKYEIPGWLKEFEKYHRNSSEGENYNYLNQQCKNMISWIEKLKTNENEIEQTFLKSEEIERFAQKADVVRNFTRLFSFFNEGDYKNFYESLERIPDEYKKEFALMKGTLNKWEQIQELSPPISQKYRILRDIMSDLPYLSKEESTFYAEAQRSLNQLKTIKKEKAKSLREEAERLPEKSFERVKKFLEARKWEPEGEWTGDKNSAINYFGYLNKQGEKAVESEKKHLLEIKNLYRQLRSMGVDENFIPVNQLDSIFNKYFRK